MLRRVAPALLLLLLGMPGLASAQYFGRNKVQYTNFKFKIIQTEHFDVYFYERERVAAMDAARMAERSYARLSKVLNHEFRERKPIILYASSADFQQTNATEVGGESTGGVTDFARNRAVMPFTGSYADFEHVLMHEMAHQFQYDIWSRGRAGAGVSTLIAIAPPLWFAEGMAEFLSIGPINSETAMWLRDASLEGKVPTIEQMTLDPYEYFPYRFGHALWSYVAERWGDEAVGAILKATLAGGIEPAFRRTIGLTLDQLSDQWRDAVQKRYLPELGARARARAVADALLTEKKSQGTLHLAPALSPDGSLVAYFTEKDFYSVDLWLADGNTGKPKHRILKSGISSNYETYRFINSQANWSPDGKDLAFAAKRGARDEIVVVDAAKNRPVDRIKLKLSGVTTPSWSPDGQQLVFTGYEGGFSDLFVVNRDGSGLRRLTEDKYADLHPVWSPDGKTIAFATDRGPETDFHTLAIGNFRIAQYDLATGNIRILDKMDKGKNVSPQWAPDGRSIAFVSDRTGVSNIFLYDMEEHEVYQLTDFYTGAQGITPLSPVLSWAPKADRLAFVYYENGKYDIYSLTNPRSLRRGPYRPQAVDSTAILAATPPIDTTRSLQVRDDVRPQVGEGGSIYRTPSGFRSSGEVARSGDTTMVTKPVSIAALLDSADFSLPDTSEFTLKKYRVSFSPDYVARPNIGYTRDNFGRGFYGGSAVSLSDMLGNHQLVFAGYVNGHVNEAQILAAYADLSHRINWATGITQDPYYFLEPSTVEASNRPGEAIFVTNIRRLIVRIGVRFGVLPGEPVPAHRNGAALRQRGRRHPAGEGALRSGNGVPHRRPVPRHPQSAGCDLRAAERGIGVRQLADRVRESVLRPSLPDRGRPLDRELDVHPDHRRLSALRSAPRALRVRQPVPLLWQGGAGRERVPHLRGKQRSDPRQHLGLVPAQRVPQRRPGQQRDRLRRARPPGGYPAGGGLVRAAHAALQPVHERSRAPAPDGDCRVLRHGPDLGRSQHHPLEPYRERRPDRRAGPAQDHRRLAARQPVRVRHRPAGLRHPVGPPCGHRALDLQPRYGLLEHATGRRGRGVGRP